LSRVAVIGAGYVGLTTAACLADLGNDVVVVDINREKIEMLLKHQVPFFEPGLTELVQRNAESRRLRFTTSYADAVPGAEYAIIAVSTPEGEGGEADLSYVEAAAASIADHMTGPLVVVNKSTVPPLTGDMVSEVLRKRNSKHESFVVSNPEFLREGSAIQDFMHPDRVVVGGHDRGAAEKVAKLYEPLEAPILITPNIYTAEMVKYASNAFLAARISFINEIARICERVDADAKLVAEGMGMDKRIGPYYLDAGIGYGGSCLVGEEMVVIRRDGHIAVTSLEHFFRQFDTARQQDVLAWRSETGAVEFLPVSGATMRPFEGEIIEVRTKLGRRVLCTPDHPFVTRGGTKLASQLTTADRLPLAVGDFPGHEQLGGVEIHHEILVGAPGIVHDRRLHRFAGGDGESRTASADSEGIEYGSADTAWVRVTAISRRAFSGPVYSLEVPGAHTFVTSGGLVTHNCFPKDVKALAALAERFDYHPELLHAVMDINRDQRMLVIDKLRESIDGLNDKVVGLLGLAFKPNTDDLREAPSLDIARVLLAAGAHVRGYDPAAMERMQAIVPDMEYTKDPYELAAGADALVVVTEWNEFRHLDMLRIKTSMRRPVVIDGRNIYVPAEMREMGFTYRGIGRE
jgi:UDP-glucose 6-dehydrogenase